jgi:hypothetical protein
MPLLIKAVPLQHPSPQAELFLASDASDSQIGGIIQQKSGDHWRPFGFFFRNLSDMESHYSTFPESCLTWNLIIPHDQELLAAYASIQHFRHFCDSRPFQLWMLSAWLAMSSQVFIDQWSLKNSEKTFFPPAQHFPPREACLLAACLFLDMSDTVLPGCGSLGLDLPALSAEQDSPRRQDPAAAHPPMAVLSPACRFGGPLQDSNNCNAVFTMLVPDKRSLILEVVVVRRIFNLGTGNLEWGGNGKG